jgi:hypothetical protein
MWERLFTRSGPLFLVVRRWQPKPHFYAVVLQWIAANYPELRPLFYLTTLPYRLPQRNPFVLHIPWLQDPVQRWSFLRYEQANRLAGECDVRSIPVINRVDRLINATKSVGARLMGEAGIRTPKTAAISDPAEFRDTLLGIPLPLFVRDDWGHGGAMLRADTRAEAIALPVERFQRPIAVELIDIPDRRDGLYRKYRYFAAGSRGVTHHLQVSEGWLTRGSHRVKSDRTREEELSFINRPDPNHDLLQKARRALGLDLVAFDYGYDHDGKVVVWEANPYPSIPPFSKRGLAYRNGALDRTMAAMLALYLEAAGLPVSQALSRRAAY